MLLIILVKGFCPLKIKNIITQFPGGFRLNTSDCRPPFPPEVKTLYHDVLMLNEQVSQCNTYFDLHYCSLF